MISCSIHCPCFPNSARSTVMASSGPMRLVLRTKLSLEPLSNSRPVESSSLRGPALSLPECSVKDTSPSVPAPAGAVEWRHVRGPTPVRCHL